MLLHFKVLSTVTLVDLVVGDCKYKAAALQRFFHDDLTKSM